MKLKFEDEETKIIFTILNRSFRRNLIRSLSNKNLAQP